MLTLTLHLLVAAVLVSVQCKGDARTRERNGTRERRQVGVFEEELALLVAGGDGSLKKGTAELWLPGTDWQCRIPDLPYFRQESFAPALIPTDCPVTGRTTRWRGWCCVAGRGSME